MQLSDLRPVCNYAIKYGAKAIVYGSAGSGKTPIAATAPKPFMLICEPGMLSMTKVNIPAIPAFNAAEIDDRFAWIFGSNETKNFDTICIDSLSQMCEIILTDELKKNKDGRKAYGELSRKMMEKLNGLYFMPEKHLYLICKQQMTSENYKRPFFPGQDLPVKIPHLFDFILHLGIQNVPGMGQVSAFRCNQSVDVLARARTGNLNDFEPPDFGALCRKAMS